MELFRGLPPHLHWVQAASSPPNPPRLQTCCSFSFLFNIFSHFVCWFLQFVREISLCCSQSKLLPLLSILGTSNESLAALKGGCSLWALYHGAPSNKPKVRCIQCLQPQHGACSLQEVLAEFAHQSICQGFWSLTTLMCCECRRFLVKTGRHLMPGDSYKGT